MHLEYIPLLKVQHELYLMPRGLERFQAYLGTMVDSETGDIKFPMSAMNPMGKDHVPALLSEYLALDADGLAVAAVSEATTKLRQVPGKFKVTLILSDDLMGGWTNHYSTEFTHRSGSKAYFKRGWLTGLLWTSATPSGKTTREEVLTTIYRGTHIQMKGFAYTLGEILSQEGYAMAMADCTEPTLEVDDLAYTQEVITPFLESKDYPTIMTCLFGDAAAKSLGYEPMGLSRYAGLALALHIARAEL